MKKEKGEFGYISYLKIYNLLMTLACLTVVMILVLFGFFRYHSVKQIYTVIAAVMAIPASKFLVEYIILIPFNSTDRVLYEELLDDKYKVLTELVITTEQRVMYAQFAVIKGKTVYCCAENKRTDSKELEKYLLKILNSEFKDVDVKVYDDIKQYKKDIQRIKNKQEDIRDKRIAELMCIYSM